MSYSYVNIEIDINDQIKEFHEEREIPAEKQQSQISSKIVNETSNEGKDYGRVTDT